MLNRKARKKIIKWLAYLSLLVAFFIGQYRNDEINLLNSSKLISEYGIDRLVEKGGVFYGYKADRLIAYVVTGKQQGYGGELTSMVLCDTLGKVIDIELVSHAETLSYIAKLRRKEYFVQYPEKELNSKFVINEDIDAVSNATISSNAIAIATRKAAWKVAKNTFKLPLPDVKQKWHVGLYEILAIVIFILATIAVYRGKKRLRMISLFSSFIVLGFLLNASVSLSHIGKLLMGYIPDIRQHFVWWVLLFGNLIAIIFIGKNVYCTAVCPFHAAQILLNKISNLNFKISKKYSKILLKTPNFLLWLCLVLILLSKNPTLCSYEPFSMFFSLDGIGIQWYILPAALVGSLFMSDFFCRYFCPVGASFQTLVMARYKYNKKLDSKRKRK